MRPFHIIFNAWLAYLAGITCLGWALSAFGAYRMMAPASVILVSVITILSCKSWRITPHTDRKQLCGVLLFAPFLILLVVIILTGSLYLTTVLDSLGYRIPRMLMWLQEGRVHYINNTDARLNFMTPVWEFASTPIYQITGFRFLWLGSAISWVLLYLSLFVTSFCISSNADSRKWLTMIPAASVGFVLQASSTMNDIWAAALVSISLVFIIAFEKKPSFGDIVSSGLALSLAAGVKPHFAVLGLPWLLWFLFSPFNPLASVRWRWTLPLGVLAVLCSPLLTFVNNYIHYGSFKGEAGDGFGLGLWWMNILLGTVMMLWQIIQLPINPLAGTINSHFQHLLNTTGLAELAPRFRIGTSELLIVDYCSIGFVAALPLCIGFYLALRNCSVIPKWIICCLTAGAFSFLVTISQVVPGTLGRSFLAFVILFLPLALFGLAKLRLRPLKIIALVVVGTALFSLVVSPSHPLWPAKTTANYLNRFHDHFVRYLSLQKKPYAGTSVIKTVPDDAKEIGIMAVGDQSLIQLWNHRNPELKVRFLPSETNIADLIKNGPRWFILIAADTTVPDALFAKLAADLEKDSRFEPFFSDEFISRNVRGPERWILYRYLGDRVSN